MGTLVLLTALIVHLSMVFVGFDNAPRDGHEFRQTQTAMTAFWIKQDGWSMPPPLPVFGPPWSLPMEFPLYQGIAAGVSVLLDSPLEPTARAVSLVFFYLSLPALVLLGKLLPLTPGQRLLLPAVTLLTPLYVFFARTIAIESLAFCGSVWFLWAFNRLLTRRTMGLAIAATLFAGVASLAKITTYLIFLVPAGLLVLRELWYLRAEKIGAITRPLLPAISTAAIALAVGYIWVVYSDVIKLSNPLSAFMESANMRPWNFGTLEQRVSLGFWQTILKTLNHDLLTYGNLMLAPILWLSAPTRHRFAGGMLLVCFLAGPLAFANLYYVHNYYYFASGIFLVALLVLGRSRLLAIPGISRGWVWTAIFVSLAFQGFGYRHGIYLLQTSPAVARPPIGAVIQAATDPDEIIVIIGEDWNPATPYFAERKAIMLRNFLGSDLPEIDAVLKSVADRTIGAFVARGVNHSIPDREAEFAAKLGLQRQPRVRGDQCRLYLSPERAAEMPQRLPKPEDVGFEIVTIETNEIPGVALERHVVAQIPDQSIFVGFSPRPQEVAAPFGVSGSLVGDQLVFNIHAPTDIVFELPAGITTAELEFGFHAAAFAAGNLGDGVDLSLEFQPHDSLDRSTLWAQHLDPFKNPADQAPQNARITFASLPAGRAFLRVKSEAAHNYAFDWTYWQRVEFR